jgi:hypothetical protein
LPTASLKVMPQVGSDEPLVARVIGSPWLMSGNFYKASEGSISYRKSEADQFYKLPVLNVLGATYFEGDMSLAFKDMKVLADLLKK